MTVVVELKTVDDTHEFGRRLAGVLRAGDLLLLSGPLGAGKTALTRASAPASAYAGRSPRPPSSSPGCTGPTRRGAAG